MSRPWQVQAAKARQISKFRGRSLADGPQIVTKRGETGMLVPIDQWRRLGRQAKPDIKDLLLAPEARTDALTPPRPDRRHRASLDSE